MDTNYKTQIRKELHETGCRVIFTSAAKLKNLLCNNKSKLLPNNYLGVYESSCDCRGGGQVYIGETNKRVLTRSIEQLQLNIPNIFMGGLIGCTQEYLQNCSTYTNVK